MYKVLYILFLLSQVTLAQISTGGGGDLKFDLKSFSEIHNLEKKFIHKIHKNSHRCKHAKAVLSIENIVSLYEKLITLESLDFFNNNNIDSTNSCHLQIVLSPSECFISGASKELIKLIRHPEFDKYLTKQLIDTEGYLVDKHKPKTMINYFREKLKKLQP
jgi:hypothetical protein